MSLFDRFRHQSDRPSDQELDDELTQHMEMEALALERAGLSPEDARREARRRFGGVDKYAEEVRDVRGGRWLEWFGQDAKYALRVARRFPAFTAIVVATLAVAIGANTAVFSVIDRVVLAPLPFPRDRDLMLLYAETPDGSNPRFSASYADFLDWRRDTRSFAGMSAFTSSTLTTMEAEQPERLSGLLVTSDYFDVLQARPALGRLFRASDQASEVTSMAVITNAFWTRRFGSDLGVVGRDIRLGSGPVTVIGVLPPDFDRAAPNIDVVTILNPSIIPNVENHAQHTLSVIARLRPGVSIAVAQQDLRAVAERLARTHPSIAGWKANVFSLRDEGTRTVRQPLLILMAGAALVMLIACTNVASLLLTRNALRHREVALRRALGASRGRLVTQMLVECLALALLGLTAGVGVALAILKLIARVAPQGLIPQDVAIPLDWRMLGFALALVTAATLVAGLLPALRLTVSGLAQTLREGGRSAAGGLSALRARRLLVVTEISLAVVLLVSAGLVLQSLRTLTRNDPGFRPERLVAARVSVPNRYRDSTQVRFIRELQERLTARAEVESAAGANVPPMSQGGINTKINVIGRPNPANEDVMSNATVVTPGYFRTIGMSFVRGEDVTWEARELVVNEALAKRFWPNENAIGKRIGFGRDSVGMPIVGIVADIRNRGLGEEPTPMIYMSYRGAANIVRTLTFVVRGRGRGGTETVVSAVVSAMKAALREVDPAVPLYTVQSVPEMVNASIAQPRLNTTMLTLFAGIAVVLAVLGIYGVVSYSVTQRSQEMGVRMALGAQRTDVVRMVLREGLLLAVGGAVIGLVGALAGTTVIRGWLYGIERNDPTTMLGAAAALIVVALLASYLPATRASRVDPVTAMRAE
ncbi:MAG TPA: ABC transporter permease [Gemmatimonadaceae bacterium]|nr:ABC transporter permease [Gemmatimonadaceae bacterium]